MMFTTSAVPCRNANFQLDNELRSRLGGASCSGNVAADLPVRHYLEG